MVWTGELRAGAVEAAAGNQRGQVGGAKGGSGEHLEGLAMEGRR